MSANKLLYLNHCTACGHRAAAVAPLGRCPRCYKALPAPTAPQAAAWRDVFRGIRGPVPVRDVLLFDPSEVPHGQ